ncbi:group I truncated hemoglobin [Phenylobacterium sp.]|uniref:group I truncated hemoglobin n=1 Tax=Phenylobacterium sp. TaxID=1871053 RepID=UPI003D2BCF43
MLKVLIVAAALAGAPENPSPTHPNEEAVEPYAQSNANAGATPFAEKAMWEAFHGQAGVDRIVDELVDRSVADPRISEIFKSHDLVRLRRTLKEQFCYILNGGCDYTGRSMADAHKDLGVQNADFNALVEHLQVAMDREKIPFRVQNRFLAKLAPMQRQTVER